MIFPGRGRVHSLKLPKEQMDLQDRSKRERINYETEREGGGQNQTVKGLEPKKKEI